MHTGASLAVHLLTTTAGRYTDCHRRSTGRYILKNHQEAIMLCVASWRVRLCTRCKVARNMQGRVPMPRSMCWSHATWRNEEVRPGGWGTYPPGKRVNLGDVGRFTNKEKRFIATRNLERDYHIQFTPSDETPISDEVRAWISEIDCGAIAEANTKIPSLCEAEGGITLITRRQHAALLQRWSIDPAFVWRRTRTRKRVRRHCKRCRRTPLSEVYWQHSFCT
jgi:hypothetical protein